MNLYQLKANLANVGAALEDANTNLMNKVSNAATKPDEIKDLKDIRADLQDRFNTLKAEVDRLEAEQKAKLEEQQRNSSTATDPIIAAKAEIIRAAIEGRKPRPEVLAQLQAIPAPTLSGGENFLPSTMQGDLVHEPFAKNPLRSLIKITNSTGLDVPIITFTLDDDDSIGDDETAKEMIASGGKVSFGRFKTKVKCKISDTVLHGSDLELVTAVEDALRSGLAAKEKKVSFVAHANAQAGHEHMSFYQEDSGEYVITAATGTDTFGAIKAAIAALHEDFRENATVVMRFSDYVEALEDLANGNMAFFEASPEKILGKPVEFCDSAVVPVVGDFRYCQLNYDITTTYDTDKDVDSGDYIFVLTAWFDQKRLLNSAFRLADVVVVS